MLRSFFTRLIEFAGECFRAEYATGRSASRLPCSGNDETAQAIALGGASLAQELCSDRSRSSVADYEITVFHEAGDDA